MKTTTKLMLILISGSAWGVAELIGKDLLPGLGIGAASIWLAVWAVLLLSIARGVWNKVGSSALIGLVAAGLKCAGPPTSACHLLGIASVGLVFDLCASTVASRDRSRWWRYSLVGLLTAYGARAFFVLYSIHIARLERWVEGGSAMAVEHVVRGGSVVAAALSLLAPLGFLIGHTAAGIASSTTPLELSPDFDASTAERRSEPSLHRR